MSGGHSCPPRQSCPNSRHCLSGPVAALTAAGGVFAREQYQRPDYDREDYVPYFVNTRWAANALPNVALWIRAAALITERAARAVTYPFFFRYGDRTLGSDVLLEPTGMLLPLRLGSLARNR